MDAQLLREMLDYDPSTGLFTWKVDRTRGVKAGDVAGSVHPTGYRRIKINGLLYLASRLAWMYVYGAIPDGFTIDHINHIRSDDRITNLRLATYTENARNKLKPRSNTSGFKGVYLNKKTGMYAARAKSKGKWVYFGRRHESAVLAAAAYDRGITSLYGEFASFNFANSAA